MLTRKPFVTSSLQSLWVLLILFVPSLLFDVLDGGFVNSRNHSLDFTGLSLFALMFVSIIALCFVFWQNLFWQNRGYSVWGASDEFFEDALHASLGKLELSYEETATRLRLVSLDADLTVSAPGFGPGSIRIKQPRHASTLKQIAKYLNEYFATVPGKVSLSIFYFYAFAGALMLVAALAFSRNR